MNSKYTAGIVVASIAMGMNEFVCEEVRRQSAMYGAIVPTS